MGVAGQAPKTALTKPILRRSFHMGSGLSKKYSEVVNITHLKSLQLRERGAGGVREQAAKLL